MMDTKKLSELIDLFSSSDLTKMELEENGMRLCLKQNVGTRRQSGQRNIQILPEEQTPLISAQDMIESTTAGTDNSAPEDAVQDDYAELTAPLVGTFYSAPAEGAAPFVSIGDRVGEGDPVCIIEAMKVMNEIHAQKPGVIISCLPADGDFVEFGQTLFKIEEDQ